MVARPTTTFEAWPRVSLLADLPGLAPVDVPTIEVRRSDQQPTVHTVPTTVEVAGRVLGVDPAALLRSSG